MVGRSRARYDSESGTCSTTWFILTEIQGKRACVLEVVHEESRIREVFHEAAREHR